MASPALNTGCPTTSISSPRIALVTWHAPATESHDLAGALAFVPPDAFDAVQVAERGLVFVRAFSEILAAQHAEGKLASHFREAWAFTACVSLAKVTSRAHAAHHATQLSAAKWPKKLEIAAGCVRISMHTYMQV